MCTRASVVLPRRLLAFLFAAGAAACNRDPVEWTVERSASAMIAPGARLTLMPGGIPAMVASWTPMRWPADSGVCSGSMVAARGRGDTVYAAWWAPRPDSSGRLLAARSDDGGLRWRPAVTADSAERAHVGCRRPPPSLAVDSVNGNVHLAYFLRAPEGPGVFFTHSMEAGALYHAPVPVVYGERMALASVASRADTVAVAYEEPNGVSPRVWLALSRTAGHIFDYRMSVSPSSSEATRPAVAVRDGRIAVAWFQTGRGGGPGAAVVRVGTLAW